MSNGHTLLQNIRPSSGEHFMLKALFVKSLGRKKFFNNNVGNARSLSRAHPDFESIRLCRRLDVKKKSPSGNYHVDNEVIESFAYAIASIFSTTT